MQLRVESEHARLRAVVMATPEHFRVVDPVNVTQERFFSTAPPSVKALVAEQATFAALLEGRGARVLWATPLPECPLQVNTRDVGVVVGGRYFEGRMRRAVRAREPEAVRHVVDSFVGERVAIRGGDLEGGDVLVDGRDVYVGLGERTDAAGAAELGAYLGPGYAVHVLALAPRVLHLDVVLTLLPGKLALIWPPGIADIPEVLRRSHDFVAVTDEEQQRLATNVLCLDERTVVADERNERVAALLTDRGLDVRVLPFAETTKIGGSFRCSTLPLVRGDEPPD